MNINYKIQNKLHKVIFCPDGEGLKLKNKQNSYMQLSRDLKNNYNDGKILLIIDKKINKKIVNYMIHDLKISFKNLNIMFISGSKKNKNQKNLFKIIDYLFLKKFTKKSVLISCGGGVIGDLCGLSSSLYLRGLIHYHIPTTMTSIIDSCIGGKTGINYKGIINSVGNYYHAEKVYISKNIINLIPKREFIAGIPEILKCGLINDRRILSLLKDKKKYMNRDFNFLTKIINLSLKTKIKFFLNDIYEESQRLNLNFGHTFAHSIEMSLKSKNKEHLRHGEAVGLGLLCEIYYANNKNNNYYLVERILKQYGLPTDLNIFTKYKKKNILKNLIYKNIFLDKKTLGKFPRFIKLNKIGKSKVSDMKNNKKIKETIDKVIFN